MLTQEKLLHLSRNGGLCGVLTCPAPLPLSPEPLSCCTPAALRLLEGPECVSSSPRILPLEHWLYFICPSCGSPEENPWGEWLFLLFFIYFLSFSEFNLQNSPCRWPPAAIVSCHSCDTSWGKQEPGPNLKGRSGERGVRRRAWKALIYFWGSKRLCKCARLCAYLEKTREDPQALTSGWLELAGGPAQGGGGRAEL